MPGYTMRPTWPHTNTTTDYVFLIDGKEAGRCYETTIAGGRRVWLWTVYGSPLGGTERSLAIAKMRFKEATGG